MGKSLAQATTQNVQVAALALFLSLVPDYTLHKYRLLQNAIPFTDQPNLSDDGYVWRAKKHFSAQLYFLVSNDSLIIVVELPFTNTTVQLAPGCERTTRWTTFGQPLQHAFDWLRQRVVGGTFVDCHRVTYARL